MSVVDQHKATRKPRAARRSSVSENGGITHNQAITGVQCCVTGKITSATGAPQLGLCVTALNRNLRTEQALGEAITDKSGTYQILYSSRARKQNDAGNANLQIRVFDGDGRKLAESEVRFNSGVAEVIDLVVSIVNVSEWERITLTVTPLLKGQSARPDALSPADIDFVVSQTALDRTALDAWAWACRSAVAQSLLAASRAKPIAYDSLSAFGKSPGGVQLALTPQIVDWLFYFACARNALPQDTSKLLARRSKDLLGVVRHAVAVNQIPVRILNSISSLSTAIDRVRIELSLMNGSPEGLPRLGDILNTISPKWINTTLRRKLVDLVARVGFEADDFQAEALKSGLKPKDARILIRSLRLARLADGHLAAISALQAFLTDDNDASLAPLAVLEPDKWFDLAYQHGVPSGFAGTPDLYARRMLDALQHAVPEAALRSWLAKEGDGGLSGAGFTTLGRLLSNNPKFSFVADDVEEFVASADLSGIKEDEAEITVALRQLRALHRAGVHWREAPVFINAGIASVEAIAEYGSAGLQERLGGQIDAHRAIEITHASRLMKAAGMRLMNQMLPLMHGSGTEVMQPRKLDAETQQMVDASQSLRRLFSALEKCACDPCQSVLSPSAYLVDLLNFVARDSRVSWNLQDRRADIYDLELSCDNAQIELPHIDLVNEILENAIALPYKVSLPSVPDVVAALKQHPYPAALVAALQETTWEQLAEPSLWCEVGTKAGMGTTYAVIADRYHRWGIEIRSDYFGILGHGENQKLDLVRIDVNSLIHALDQGEQPDQAITDYFGHLALGNSKLPADSVQLQVVPIVTGRRWRITISVQGQIEVDEGKGHIRFGNGGKKLLRKYSAAALRGTREALNAKRFGGVLLAEAHDASNFRVTHSEAEAWAYSKIATFDFVYVPSGVVITSIAYQSTARDRDLAVRPQHRNPRTYKSFLARAGAVYPWTLPYDIDLAEARYLLSAAGIGRGTLMQAALPQADEARRVALAMERLGITRTELALATSVATDADVWANWGLDVRGVSATIRDGFDEVEKTGTPLHLLSTVSILIQQARLTFVELLWLLQSEFINPDLAASISIPDDATAGAECDPTRLVLTGSSASLFDRMHRFVRWQRRLKWSMPELDFALRILAAQPGYSPEYLVRVLADIEDLRVRYGIPVDTLLTAFYGFDRVSYSERKAGSIKVIVPLYERTFQNPQTAMAGGTAGTRSPDPALAYATLGSAGSTISIGDGATAVAACVGLHAHEILPLLNVEYQVASPDSNVNENTRLGRDHLRILLRDAALARALHVSPRRLATLIDLQGSAPFESPRALLAFCDDVGVIVQSGFDINQLHYVLTHRGAQSFTWVFGEEQGRRILEGLQIALSSAEAQGAGSTAPDALTAAQVAALLDNAASKDQRLLLVGELTQFGGYEIERIIASLWPAFDDAFMNEARLRELVDVAVSWHRRAAIVSTFLGQAIGVEVPLVEQLLWFHLRSAGNAAAMEMFADPKPRLPAQRFEDISRLFDQASIAQCAEFRALLKLHKFRLLNDNWRLAKSDLARFPGSVLNFWSLSGLVLDTLPVTNAVGRLADWKSSALLLQLCRAAPGMTTVVDDYTRAIAPPEADPIGAGAAVWASALDLPLASVRDFAGSGLLDFDSNHSALQACRDPLRILAWYELMLLARRYSLGASEIKLLIAEVPGRPSIDVATRALQARFGEAQWRDVMVKAANALRAEQRDRLVDYLLWCEKLPNADSLYERYLIDVQMAPCMNTTRLLQSIAAVQLYVQRCLMNLEAGVAPGMVDPDQQWTWRKNYRVWEANRKVFLYPENWLYPELRDDKSEIYRGFESALMQSEASDTNAINAVQGYLENLTDVAQISIMGMYEESPRTLVPAGAAHRPSRTLHVLGRSPDAPYIYFYRSNQQNGEAGSRWTPWERITLDLPACHIVPFVLGGELHVVWPIVELERDELTKKEHYNIRLAWSRRTSLGWAKRKLALDTATRIEKHFRRDERGSFALKLSERQNGPRTAAVELYVARKTPSLINEGDLAANTVLGDYLAGEETSSWLSDWNFSVSAYLKYRDTGRIVKLDGCQYAIIGLKYGSSSYPNWDNVYFFGEWGGPSRVQTPASGPGFPADGSVVSLTVHNDLGNVLIEAWATVDGVRQTVATSNTYSVDPPNGQWGTGTVGANLLFTAAKDPDFDDPAIDGYARVKMDLQGRFVMEIGRDTCWIVDSGGTALEMPDEVLSWESRLHERNTYPPLSAPGLYTAGAQAVFPKSNPLSAYMALRAASANTASGESWYWEQSTASGTARFFRFMNAASPGAMVAVQPAGFEDVREYSYRYAQGREFLFQPEAQEAPANKRFGVDMLSDYFPGAVPGTDPRSLPLVQFHLGMPYASYNWEVFYHLPMAAARFLATQQRFEEAQRWLSCVFDPNSNDSAAGRQRYWRCLPFRHANTPQSIQQLLQALADPNADPATKQSVQDQVAAWESNPFSPFALARQRTSAYEWYAVSAYVSNLIEWGDSLFRRDTRESINEAAQLYVFASTILGRRPEVVPKQGFQVGSLSYRTIGGRWDDFSNAWVRLIDTPLGKLILEWLLALQKLGGYNPHAYDQQIEQICSVGALYFCIPQNAKVLQLWDTVADRLWKVRHCQNIEGVERPLALLDPPIDPELLIRARLAGVDIADVLADLYAPSPAYRYSFLLKKALEFCAELKSLGAALLVAIEKKDAENLAMLRLSQEIAMQRHVELVKKDLLAEAEANIRVLEQSRLTLLARYRYLQRLLGSNEIRFDAQGVPVMEQHGTLQVRDAGAPEDFRGLALVQSEVDQVTRMQDANIASTIASALKLSASVGRGTAAVLSALGIMTEPLANAANFIAQGLVDLGDVSALAASSAEQWSRRSGLIANFQRRREDWIQQSTTVVDDIRQIDRQIAASEIRMAIAEKELAIHRNAIEDAKDIDDYMRDRKFSSADLYSWMETQFMATYHVAYQLAFDLAKRVERAWRRELGETDSQWIKFGYWDGAKKGLLAGEQLHLDLNRMQMAFIERSKREYEISKDVSLFTLDPAALVTLRELGRCEISIPEALFDLDYPGHYCRRIKDVKLSIPCVAGVFGGMPATLKLLRSTVRTKAGVTEGYARIDDDSRFIDSIGGTEAVVMSTGLKDSGLFESHLHDERFLPFEGSGAISTWEITLPDEFRAFDYECIADVILHVRYTAREGGEDMKTAALGQLRVALNQISRMSKAKGLVRMFSLRQDFPTAWQLLKNPDNAGTESAISLAIPKRFFPFILGSKRVGVRITAVDMYAVPAADPENAQFPDFIQLFPPGENDPLEWGDAVSIGPLPGRTANAAVVVYETDDEATWRLSVGADDAAILKARTADLLWACQYEVS